eukprot:TRINITY_DN23029_c0_g1_i1.p1 TRINITY_DN23029_c0_g1~~TRINITY_DN23029_c0_g1_i1.p1  ORF type:complete len:502 (+),score=133.27 TRINITY_DN23029_c0_g1_i1:50-1555(+)
MKGVLRLILCVVALLVLCMAVVNVAMGEGSDFEGYEEWRAGDGADVMFKDVPFMKPSKHVESQVRRLNVENKHNETREKVYSMWESSIAGEEGVHIIHTVQCTHEELWQSFALEFSWEKVKQKGALTRIVSGCVQSDGSVAAGYERSQRRVVASDKFFIFYTPEVVVSDYPRLYRPVSVWHWVMNGLPPEKVIVYLDPDTIFVKPLPHTLISAITPGTSYSHHNPVLERAKWHKAFTVACARLRYSGINRKGRSCRPVAKPVQYSVTAPYALHRADMASVASFWVRFAVSIKDAWGWQWWAEPAGFSSALLKTGITAQKLHTGVLWTRLLDAPGKVPGVKEGKGVEGVPQEYLPSLVRYDMPMEVNKKSKEWAALRVSAHAQSMWEKNENKPLLEYIYWSKEKLPVNLLDCNEALLFEYPSVQHMVGRRYKAGLHDHKWGLFLASVVPTINTALVTYKTKHCKDPNLLKLWRTATDRKWMSRFLPVANESSSLGYEYKPLQ